MDSTAMSQATSHNAGSRSPRWKGAEEAVEHHVQVGAVELDHVVHVLPLQVGGVVEDVHPVGGDGGGVQVHLVAQTAQRQVEEAHGQVELVPGGG